MLVILAFRIAPLNMTGSPIFIMLSRNIMGQSSMQMLVHNLMQSNSEEPISNADMNDRFVHELAVPIGNHE